MYATPPPPSEYVMSRREIAAAAYPQSQPQTQTPRLTSNTGLGLGLVHKEGNREDKNDWRLGEEEIDEKKEGEGEGATDEADGMLFADNFNDDFDWADDPWGGDDPLPPPPVAASVSASSIFPFTFTSDAAPAGAGVRRMEGVEDYEDRNKVKEKDGNKDLASGGLGQGQDQGQERSRSTPSQILAPTPTSVPASLSVPVLMPLTNLTDFTALAAHVWIDGIKDPRTGRYIRGRQPFLTRRLDKKGQPLSPAVVVGARPVGVLEAMASDGKVRLQPPVAEAVAMAVATRSEDIGSSVGSSSSLSVAGAGEQSTGGQSLYTGDTFGPADVHGERGSDRDRGRDSGRGRGREELEGRKSAESKVRLVSQASAVVTPTSSESASGAVAAVGRGSAADSGSTGIGIGIGIGTAPSTNDDDFFGDLPSPSSFRRRSARISSSQTTQSQSQSQSPLPPQGKPQSQSLVPPLTAPLSGSDKLKLKTVPSFSSLSTPLTASQGASSRLPETNSLLPTAGRRDRVGRESGGRTETKRGENDLFGEFSGVDSLSGSDSGSRTVGKSVSVSASVSVDWGASLAALNERIKRDQAAADADRERDREAAEQNERERPVPAPVPAPSSDVDMDIDGADPFAVLSLRSSARSELDASDAKRAKKHQVVSVQARLAGRQRVLAEAQASRKLVDARSKETYARLREQGARAVESSLFSKETEGGGALRGKGEVKPIAAAGTNEDKNSAGNPTIRILPKTNKDSDREVEEEEDDGLWS